MTQPRTRVNILGVEVDALTLDAVVARINGWIVICRQSYGIFHDVYWIVLSGQNTRLRAIHQDAGLVAPDGRP